ncbi:M20 family metallopeptidase [Aquincola tertiaricarbonis]|uniref:M20 family metallopeptidase n=1 Tax=Aquincola tertiaricarbonis TaxID=391953 RepID=A0ABY4S4N1_AQUTE|nr:M20 aminoacylase family protein [Aquincola tertiaricarbonis]URI08401.1 M20 family metallopeptidase [Aquincola tertiaricarbonis]
MPEMVALRHHLHAHPELAFEERATSQVVADCLAQWGYEVHRGLGRTGVVGTLRRGSGPRRLGLRADMDALPIAEATGLPYASRHAGRMHACGHDGHTAILLAAARHIAEQQHFDGTLHLIFQPAEEGLGGGREMVADGLFERFPCDAVFALHNMPGHPVGSFGFREGPFMASSDTVIIDVHGRGGHGSAPHLAADPVVAAAHIIVALQTIVSRQTDPRDMAVVSVGAIHAGDAPNVIPAHVQMKLTVRAQRPEVRAALRERITALVQAQAQTLGVRAEVDYHWRYPALVNHPGWTRFARDVARDWLGEEGLMPDLQPLTGSEDFSFMLEACPGAYLLVGNGVGEAHGQGGCMVHNPGYDFNDAALPLAATYWTRLVQRFLVNQPLPA